MFKNLGFRESRNPWSRNAILYRRDNNGTSEDVYFDLDKKTYSAHSSSGGNPDSLNVDMRIHKAILKQLKELKWR